MTSPPMALPRQVRIAGQVGIFGFLQMHAIHKRGRRTRCRVRLVDVEGTRLLDAPAELVGLEREKGWPPTVTIEVEAVLQVCPPPKKKAKAKVGELIRVKEKRVG